MFSLGNALGSFGGGVVHGLDDYQTIQGKNLKNKQTQNEMQGLEALGRAFQPDQGPMPPNPGQASMPAQPPMGPPPNQPTPMAGPQMGGMPPAAPMAPGAAGPAPGPPPQPMAGPPGGTPAPRPATGPGGMPQLDLPTLIQRIQAKNPNIQPQVMISALNNALPMLSVVGKQQLAELKQAHEREMMDLRERTADRLDRRAATADRAGADKQSEAETIAEEIAAGRQPPTTTGLYGKSAAVKSALAKKGFDLTRANLEWQRAQKQVASLNGPQMTRFVGLAGSVDKTIDEVNSLAEEMDNIGIPAANYVKIQALAQTAGNTPEGQLAARYIAGVNTLKEEFANLANGGYAPTEPAWKLANEQINANFGVKQLRASLSEIQRLIRYRLQGMPNMGTLGPGAPNRYTPGGAPPAGGASGGGPATPTVGEVRDGFRFLGGDPANKESWQALRLQ